MQNNLFKKTTNTILLILVICINNNCHPKKEDRKLNNIISLLSDNLGIKSTKICKIVEDEKYNYQSLSNDLLSSINSKFYTLLKKEKLIDIDNVQYYFEKIKKVISIKKKYNETSVLRSIEKNNFLILKTFENTIKFNSFGIRKNFNYSDYRGNFLTISIISNSSLDIVKFLVEKAKITNLSKTGKYFIFNNIIRIAIKESNKEVLQYLLKKFPSEFKKAVDFEELLTKHFKDFVYDEHNQKYSNENLLWKKIFELPQKDYYKKKYSKFYTKFSNCAYIFNLEYIFGKKNIKLNIPIDILLPRITTMHKFKEQKDIQISLSNFEFLNKQSKIKKSLNTYFIIYLIIQKLNEEIIIDLITKYQFSFNDVFLASIYFNHFKIGNHLLNTFEVDHQYIFDEISFYINNCHKDLKFKKEYLNNAPIYKNITECKSISNLIPYQYLNCNDKINNVLNLMVELCKSNIDKSLIKKTIKDISNPTKNKCKKCLYKKYQLLHPLLENYTNKGNILEEKELENPFNHIDIENSKKEVDENEKQFYKEIFNNLCRNIIQKLPFDLNNLIYKTFAILFNKIDLNFIDKKTIADNDLYKCINTLKLFCDYSDPKKIEYEKLLIHIYEYLEKNEFENLNESLLYILEKIKLNNKLLNTDSKRLLKIIFNKKLKYKIQEYEYCDRCDENSIKIIEVYIINDLDIDSNYILKNIITTIELVYRKLQLKRANREILSYHPFFPNFKKYIKYSFEIIKMLYEGNHRSFFDKSDLLRYLVYSYIFSGEKQIYQFFESVILKSTIIMFDIKNTIETHVGIPINYTNAENERKNAIKLMNLIDPMINKMSLITINNFDENIITKDKINELKQTQSSLQDKIDQIKKRSQSYINNFVTQNNELDEKIKQLSTEISNNKQKIIPLKKKFDNIHKIEINNEALNKIIKDKELEMEICKDKQHIINNMILKDFYIFSQILLNNTIFAFRILSSDMIEKKISLLTNYGCDTIGEKLGEILSKIFKTASIPFASLISDTIKGIIERFSKDNLNNISQYFINSNEQSQCIETIFRVLAIKYQNKIIDINFKPLKMIQKGQKIWNTIIGENIDNKLKFYIKTIQEHIIELLMKKKDLGCKISQNYNQKDINQFIKYIELKLKYIDNTENENDSNIDENEEKSEINENDSSNDKKQIKILNCKSNEIKTTITLNEWKQIQEKLEFLSNTNQKLIKKNNKLETEIGNLKTKQNKLQDKLNEVLNLLKNNNK